MSEDKNWFVLGEDGVYEAGDMTKAQATDFAKDLARKREQSFEVCRVHTVVEPEYTIKVTEVS